MAAAESDGRKSTTTSWIDRHRPLYDRATCHPFVLGIRDGTVDFEAFKRWLGQDYVFVREFVPFLASVLLKAWKEPDTKSDIEVVLGGIAALNDELCWFKKEASFWEVDLDNVIPQDANLKYCRFLQNLMPPEVEFVVVITAFWAIEAVYQKSFSQCLESGNKTPVELMNTCERWGSPDFGQYCFSLQKIADRCLAKASVDLVQKAENAFTCVLEHEIEFWSMSSGEEA